MGEQEQERRSVAGRLLFADALSVCQVKLSRGFDVTRVNAMRQAVNGFIRAARSAGTPPERTLASFKSMLRRIPEIERLPLDQRNDATRALVQMAIDAYYRDDGKGSDGKGSDGKRA